MTVPLTAPTKKPGCPNFSSGPCAKHPGYSVATAVPLEILGRSHRSALGKKYLARACGETASLLGIPRDYRVAVVPASDTGAVEMAMWSLLGPRAVDVCAWETFGEGWVTDILTQLKLPRVRVFRAKRYGLLPEGMIDAAGDSTVDARNNDVVLTWNGTTSGVKVPHGDWIPADREGLTICDATSAVFAMSLPWEKLDVTTFSWQKVLGGEGGHGMIVLSPRAVARLESYRPPWPLPKIFRMTDAKTGKLTESLFVGDTINTPSMMCVADYLDALGWVKSIGGVAATIERSNRNLAAAEAFVATRPWIRFLADDKAVRSNTSVCFVFPEWSGPAGAKKVSAMLKVLEKALVAFDIGSYRDAPPGIRIWCGATVEEDDVRALLPWFEFAYFSIS